MTPRPRVLYVGDGVDEGLVVDELAVENAPTAAAALEAVETGAVDCIVSEHDLPDGSGLDLLQRVRERNQDLPFVLYPSADGAGESVASEAISADVTEYHRQDETAPGELAYTVLEAANGTRGASTADSSSSEVLERISDGFFALDDEWRFTHLNERAEELIDVDADEVVGETIWDEFPEATELAFYDEYHRAMETQEAVSFTEYYPPLETWFEVNAYPSETGLSVYFQDVTERVEREQELERYERIVETIDDGVYALDPDGTIAFVNEELAELYGRPREELLGRPATVVHNEEIGDRAAEYAAEIAAGERERGVIEHELQTADGDTIPVETRFTVLEYENGEYGRVGVVRDVSRRVDRQRELEATKDQLEEEREFFETALNAFDDVFYVLDTDGVPIQWNDRAEEVTGYSAAEIAERSVLEFVPESDHERVGAAVERILDGSVETLETELVTKDGERIPVVVNGAPITDGEGEVTGIVGSARDITEQKQREQELERTRRRFELAIQGSDVSVWEHDLETDQVHIPGDQPSQVGLGESYAFETLLEGVHPDDRDRFETAVREAAETGSLDVTYRVESDGEYRWLHAQGELRDDGTTLAGVSQDITQRKCREQDLERYEVLMEESTDVNAVLDEDGTFRYLTPSVERVLGYEPDELVGESAFDYIHPENRSAIEEVFFDPHEETDRPTREFRFARADGSWAVIEASGRNLLDDPDINGIVVYTRDITERVERERELEATAEAFHALVEAVSDREASFETTVERLLDLGREYLGVDLGFLNRVEEGVQTVEHVRGDHPRLRKGDQCPLEKSYCRLTLDSDGHWDVHDAVEEGMVDDPAYETFGLECYIAGVVTVGGDRYGTLCFADESPREPFSDVEAALVDLLAQWVSFELEQRTLESERERLAFLNRLVRHDLLNDLNVVHARAQLLDGAVSADDQPHLDLVVDRTEEMIDLVETVRSLMRAVVEDQALESIHLGEVLDEEATTVERANERAEVRVSGPTDVQVRADELLGEVFENLLVNAVEHGATGGEPPDPLVEISVETDEEHVTVHVADDGPGIPDDLKDHVFERGTTDTGSHGTGVGLYLVSELVDAYGGTVSVEDNDPTGTVFSVTLPRA